RVRPPCRDGPPAVSPAVPLRLVPAASTTARVAGTSAITHCGRKAWRWQSDWMTLHRHPQEIAMNLTKSLAVGFSLAAFSGGYALAQQAQPAPAQQPQTQQQQAQAPQQQRQAGKQTQQMSPDQLRVSELKGKQVYDRNGSEIGEIEDLVFDLQSHQVHAAIVQVGGMVGGKDYAFPLSDFKVGEKDRLVLEVDKKRMENADGF